MKSVFLAAMLCVFCGAVGEARAEVIYPYCLVRSDSNGYESCGYRTLEQCQAALFGGRTYCMANPRYQDVPERAPSSRRPRR